MRWRYGSVPLGLAVAFGGTMAFGFGFVLVILIIETIFRQM